MKRTIICFLFLLLLLITGCDKYTVSPGSDGRSTGYEVTPEMLESMAESIRASVTERYPTETSPEGEPVVFWTDGGSVWHISRRCTVIEKAAKYHSGSTDDAVNAGKLVGCSKCQNNG